MGTSRSSTRMRTPSKAKTERKPGELLTPLRAIRAQCLGCMCGSWKEVELCSITSCPLWPYRFGKRTRARKIVAEEKLLEHIEGKYWAESLEDYTSQRVYCTEHRTLAEAEKQEPDDCGCEPGEEMA